MYLVFVVGKESQNWFWIGPETGLNCVHKFAGNFDIVVAEFDELIHKCFFVGARLNDEIGEYFLCSRESLFVAWLAL